MGTMLSSHIITHHHMIRHASRSWHSNIEVLAYKEENHRNLLNRYIDDSMSMQVCCLLGGTALIIRFPVMPRTYGVATSVPTRYKNVTMSRSRQRGGRPNNHPILSDWPTVPLPAEWDADCRLYCTLLCLSLAAGPFAQHTGRMSQETIMFERGNEVHISYVKTNTTDRDSSNSGPIAPMAPITGRPK